MQVIKRDGRVVDFNSERIVDAVTKAMYQNTDFLCATINHRVRRG